MSAGQKLLIYFLCVLVGFSPMSAWSWGLKTHIWVGHRVIADVLDDGAVTILGRSYPVAPHVAAAIRAHPERYLMGNLGPDIFPDPVVGQTTVHPGIERGWKTDQWLRHLLRHATTPEEIAFAYGFTGHAAGDIFAHTYVNAYAGSIFDLTSEDSKAEVERRHFVLEKYIETRTPPADRALATAVPFSRDRLIFDSEVFREYGRINTAHHLRSMYQIREAVSNFDREIGKILGQLTAWGADYMKAHAKWTGDLVTARHAVTAAEHVLKAEQEILNAKIQAYEFAKRRLSEAQEIVKRNPELITLNEQLYFQSAKRAAEAAADAARIGAEVVKAVSDLEQTLNNTIDELAGIVCNIVGGILPKCDGNPPTKRARSEVEFST